MVLLKKTDYNTIITEIEGKIPNINNLATKTALTTVENKVPDVSNLAKKTVLTTLENKIADVTNLKTKAALTTVEDKIPDVSSLVQKTDCNTKVAAIDTKISTLEDKITKNKNELKDRSKDIMLFSIGNLMFDRDDGYQAYLIFQPVYKYFETITNTNYISSWKSKGLSTESIKLTATSDNSLTPALSHYDYNIRVKFTGSFLKQSKITYTHKKVVNIYIVYELSVSNSHCDDPTLKIVYLVQLL